MTNFLLDPRVLDGCVSESAPDVEIVAEGIGYFVLSYGQYAVFLKEEQKLPKAITDLAYRQEDSSLGSSLYICSLALVTAIPIDGDWRDVQRRHNDNKRFEVLYANGFLKGNVELLKQYGISIK